MPVRNSQGNLGTGDLFKGKGRVKLGSGAYEGQYNFSSRFEEGKGTNPEELLAAAHAACFSMATSAGLSKAGFVPTSVATTARVTIEKVGEGFKITLIRLQTEAKVPNIDEKVFAEQAEGARRAARCRRRVGDQDRAGRRSS